MRALEPEAFWRENVITVVIFQFSLNNRTAGNNYQILEVLSVGLTSFNKDENVLRLLVKKRYNKALHDVYFFRIREKP